MVCAPVRSIIPSLKLGDYLSVQAHNPCSISHLSNIHLLSGALIDASPPRGAYTQDHDVLLGLTYLRHPVRNRIEEVNSIIIRSFPLKRKWKWTER